MSDTTAQRLKEFALKKTGSMKGLSGIAEKAFVEYLEKHESELGIQGNADSISLIA